MKVLLVQPRADISQGLAEISKVEPFGLEMIAGSICSEHEVKIFDYIDSNSFSRILSEFKPDLCGISCSFTVDIYRTRAVAEKVKQWDENTIVFVGGHHASLNPGDFYDPYTDFVVIGEGEVTTREAIKCIEKGNALEGVPGMAVNRNEAQVFTGYQKPVANLDDLPRPARELTKEYRKDYFLGFRKPLAVVETARGCPYRCNFCSVWKFYQGKCRSMSVERAVSAIAAVEEDYVLIADDNFLFNIKRAAKIAENIVAAGIRKNLTIQARSDTIVDNPDLVPLLRKAGITQTFIGFEKTVDCDLDEINKQNSADNNEKALDILRRHGIKVIASFIIDPQYDRDDFKKMAEYIKKLKIRYPTFSILTPLPGTDLYENYKHKLVMHNWEMFDLMHSVLPTKLPSREFYRAYSQLYRAAYLRVSYITKTLINVANLFIKGEISLHYINTLLNAGKHFINLKDNRAYRY